MHGDPRSGFILSRLRFPLATRNSRKASSDEANATVRIAFFGTPPFAVPLARRARARGPPPRLRRGPARPAGGARRGLARAGHEDLRAGPRRSGPAAAEGGGTAGSPRSCAPSPPRCSWWWPTGRILGQDLLELAPLGALNVHASLLPRWRGLAPIQWALASRAGGNGAWRPTRQSDRRINPQFLGQLSGNLPGNPRLRQGPNVSLGGPECLAW